MFRVHPTLAIEIGALAPQIVVILPMAGTAPVLDSLLALGFE